VQYLVGTPKGRLSRYQKQLAECEWTEAREGVDVKLLPMSDEVYVLARSRDRVHKERSMRNRRLRKYLKALRRLRLERKRTPTRDELLKAIGAAGKGRTEPDKDQRLLLDQLKLTLPPQPKPRITSETKKVM
jgi:hypothetical protein